MLPTVDTDNYLGPARVLATTRDRARLQLPDGPIWARIAMPGPYRLAADDVALAIAQAGQCYVVGVIEARGRTELTVPGDLHIRAPFGRIELSAAKGVQLKGADVSIVADRLEIAARSVLERFTRATRWVRETLQLRAGRVRTQVEGDHELVADRILQSAERDVRIDGRKIHLG